MGSAATSRGVRFFNKDFLDFLEAEKREIGAKQPVVFLDPPWGGLDYKKQVQLFMRETVGGEKGETGGRGFICFLPWSFGH